MRSRRCAWVAVAPFLALGAACGGRLLDDGADATAADASEASADAPYLGEWCNPATGPVDGPGDGAIFCSKNPYADAAVFCHRAYGAPGQWNCCLPNDPKCCPLAAHMEDYGLGTTCCASWTDCTACCAGIDPKP